mgnify:FL=1|jgi:dTDP-4-dehydrorhamnose 3,5-epimerase
MSPKKIILKKFTDKRGFLIDLVPQNLKKRFVRQILTLSRKNVIRGLHFDSKLKEEKLIYLVEGKILDVCINMKKNKFYKKKFYFKLNKGEALLIPKGYAHGYEAIGDKNILVYFLSTNYNPSTSKGIIWNDKSLKIRWSIKKPIISKNDKNLPTLK